MTKFKSISEVPEITSFTGNEKILLNVDGKAKQAEIYSIKTEYPVGKMIPDGGEVFNNYDGNIASGINSHAEGSGTVASGANSHAEGSCTVASGINSHAEGNGTTASGDNSHVEGIDTTASGDYGSHAEGNNTTASGSCSHAEGDGTTASGDKSHAEGDRTTASGDYGSHAEGDRTTASGDYGSHAEGNNTTASGSCSHAEGGYTTASGSCSHAEGDGTTASGDYSHAEGDHTTASSVNQHVQGKYNIVDYSGKYAHIIGNGEPKSYQNNYTETKSNAHTVDWNGNAWYAGGLFLGNGTEADIQNFEKSGVMILPERGIVFKTAPGMFGFAEKSVRIKSSTPGSSKYFEISVDDSGAITAKDVTNTL